MPLSFLANLGSGLARFGSAFGRGAASVGKGIGRGFKRFGELGEEGMAPEPYQTPPFIPREGSGRGRSMMEIVAPSDRRLTGGADPYAPRPNMRSLEDAVAAAESDARADSLIERRNLPIPMPSPPGGPPPLTPAPSLNELRTALPPLSSRPSPPLAAPPAAPRAVPDMVPDMDLDRRNLPIPALPGHSEGPTPYNRIDAAKYDKVMSRAKRDAEGNLIPKSEGGGFERDWKTPLKNALMAASLAARSAGPGEDPLGKALGGALTAGVGSAINPQAGYEFAFDVGDRPKMEAEQAREQARQDRANMEILNRAKLEDLLATTDERRAQTDERRAHVRKLGEPTPRSRDLKIGINKQTGRREFFDANNLSELALYDPEPPKPVEPKRPTEAELMTEPTSGRSVEEIAEESYQNRGGDAYVLSKMPPSDRQLIEKGTVTGQDAERRATPEEIAAAHQRFQSAIQRQRKIDLDYTRGSVRSRRLDARQGAGAKPQASGSQSGISRPRSQFNSSKFPGLKFD